MTVITNAEDLGQYENRLSLIVEVILVFYQRPNKVRELKNLSPNFKQLCVRCFRLFNILIQIIRTILLANSKQFHQKLYANSFFIVDTTFNFL